jgi:hypothetical protein
VTEQQGSPYRLQDFTVFTVTVTVFLTFVFLNFESENTGYRYR